MNKRLVWDIFCKVIDNYGDMGVCWRLCTQLAARGQHLRLWADDTRMLEWMAPQGCAGIEVGRWSPQTAQQLTTLPRAQVVIEAFGCTLDDSLVVHYCSEGGAQSHPSSGKPVWINLEYLSAEPYVARTHGLPSPTLQGPGMGQIKHFFYPGFTPDTGGLLREPQLLERQARFDRAAWLAAQGAQFQDQRVISLFCYEPAPLGAFLHEAIQATQSSQWLVTAGRSEAAVRACLPQCSAGQRQFTQGALSVTFLRHMSQPEYDHVLWASDLNFVRGEDSLVRALWAGKPFVWQIYPQDDGAHDAKLAAFLDWLQAPPSLRQFHQRWNAPGDSLRETRAPDLQAWEQTSLAAREALLGQTDLATQLLNFVEKRR